MYKKQFRPVNLIDSDAGLLDMLSFLKKKGTYFPPENMERVVKRLTLVTVRLGFKNFKELHKRVMADAYVAVEIIDWLERGKVYNEDDRTFSPLVHRSRAVKEDPDLLRLLRQRRMKQKEVRASTLNTKPYLPNTTDMIQIIGSDESDVTFVGIGEISVGQSRDILKITSLGSCIGLVLYPESTTIREHRCAVMGHIMLSQSPSEGEKKRTSSKPKPPRYGAGKYADIAIPTMIKSLAELGHKRENLAAKIVGGANMFGHTALTMKIGKDNAEKTKQILKENGIPIAAYYVGGDTGMSVSFFVNEYRLIVKPTAKDSVSL